MKIDLAKRGVIFEELLFFTILIQKFLDVKLRTLEQEGEMIDTLKNESI